MNSTSQLDFHPDAESLNAFVEQALPEREREQVLAHLASCGRCRQVVYLAQEAAGELETAGALASQPAAVLPVESRIGSWYRGWRTTWVPAAALAAIVGVAVLVQFRHGETHSKTAPTSGQEMAKVEPQPQIQANGGKDAGSSIAPPPASPAAAERLERKTLSAEVPAGTKATAAQAVTARAPQAETDAAEVAQDKLGGVASQPGAEYHGSASQAHSIHGPAPQMQQAWTSSQQAVPLPQMPAASAAGSLLSAGANSAQVNADAALNQAKSGVAPSQSELKKSPGQQAAPRASFVGTTAGLARKVAPLNLPSGLAVQSIATGQRRTLAIDAAGAVFLRKDPVANWETVTPPWTGRAVLVRFREVTPKASGANGKDGFNGGVIAGTLSPAGVFEIETDSGQVWVSADGEDWKTK